jgi:hypothetical protein
MKPDLELQQSVCQSCSMPLENDELSGTEKDGRKSNDYCKYCFQNGAFTNPDMSMEEMATRITKKMEHLNIPDDIQESAISRLHLLKRWQTKSVAS